MSDCGNVQKVFVPGKDNQAKSDADTPVETIKGIQITDIAAEKIVTFLKNDQKDPGSHGLWISVSKDGCSGFSYKMDLKPIADSETNKDKIFTHNGATAMVDKTSYLFVTGSILDYAEALTGSGFSLTNPNIKRSCACGSSFSVK